MRVCRAAAAPAAFLAPLFVQGHRLIADVWHGGASGKILQSADIQRKCPLFSKPQMPGLLFPADEETEQRTCCAGGEEFFTCEYRDMQVGDEVRVADLPWGGAGPELGPDVPLVVTATDSGRGRWRRLTVKLAESADRQQLAQEVVDKGEWAFEEDRLRLHAGGTMVPWSFTCDCGICSQIKETSDIVDFYEVSRVGRTMDENRYYVKADIVPRGFSAGAFPPDEMYALYLYPYASRARNLAFNPTLCERIACFQWRGWKVVVRYVRDSGEVKAILEQFPARRIMTAVLGASGSQEQLARGDESIFYSEAGGGQGLLAGQLGPRMSLDGTVVLDPHLDDAARLRDPRAGADIGRATFDFVARQMHGRKVRAPTVAFDYRSYDTMWKTGAELYRHGYECLDDDTATFQRQDKSVTLEVTAGRPTCAELTGAEVAQFAREGRVCLAACRETCRKTMKALRRAHGQVDQIGKLKLALTDEEDDREDDCKRLVCEMGGIE